MMKRILLLFMVAFFARLCTWAQGGYSTLVVETKSGDKFEISLQKRPLVHVGRDEISFTCGEEVTGYLYDEVSKVYFKPYDATGIAMPTSDNVIRIVHVNQSEVVVVGINDVDDIRLHALDGRSIMVEPVVTDGILTLSLENLLPGTYILNIGNKQSFKLLRR